MPSQGRARPGLANLYNWRYQALGDLPSVTQQERFRKGNAGLAYDYQFIGEICTITSIFVYSHDTMLLCFPPVSITACCELLSCCW